MFVLASYLVKRITAGSSASGVSAMSSSSNSSHTSSSSSESLCTQCSCSGHHYRCREYFNEIYSLIIKFYSFILAPQTPSNWKLGRQIGQGKHCL